MYHPECRDSEVFLTNINVVGDSKQFKMLRWRTKRLGCVSIASNGMFIANLNPVFVSKEEYDLVKGKGLIEPMDIVIDN